MAWPPRILLLLLVPLGAFAAPGGSLFEQVTGGHGATIPYPLDTLLAGIAAELAEGRDGLRVVLIPVGRSLQRHAAGDAHYFETPRTVIAVTGAPRDATAPLLQDRLYLGHHPGAGVLEVISYHEGTGRFEFLIVDDYRAGATPRLRAGNRGLCLACHQNEAPIFSRQSWDETSANPIIARLLASTGRDYGGLPWRHGVDVPLAIDEATERANLLPVAQRIWQDGCADPDPAAAIACRARLFERTVLARLGGPVAPTPLAADPALAPLVRHWRAHWGAGLLVPDPDIPNRQPFAATLPWEQVPTDAATLRQLADVAERFDALALRAPRERWPLAAPDTPARVLHALGQFVSEADVAALDAGLRTRGGPLHEAALDCRIAERGARRNVDCRIGTRLQLQARLEGGQLRVDRLVLDGQAHAGAAWRAEGEHFIPVGTRPRGADGQALAALRIGAGAASARFVDDLAPLRATLAGLADASTRGDDDAFATGPLRRTTLVGALLDALGQPGPAPAPLAAPPAPAEAGPRADDPALRPFYRLCGQCHGETDAFPPGFLRGDDATVLRRVDACAPRMLRRLSMWAHPAGQREKTPMPPPASAQAAAIEAGAELEPLQRWLRRRIQASGRDPADFAPLAYADLPACAVYPESTHGR
jgi:hypothetical protein